MNKIERNKKTIERFKNCINTNDKILAEKLIDAKAEFASLTSDEKLYGGAGYLSVVDFMRKSFPDIHWEIADIVAEENKVAVSWICSGTHDGDFMNFPASGKKFSFSCMNFYYFNDDGKIIKDVAAQGFMGLLKALEA
ncbi:MAG: ester cyclase [Selenomonadaceae bacterium]|nr:ester cyclase [Selenomonadaceae bacterium]MBQ7629804.1 ester cyclase [Selenomonadaceae bacterium]